MIEINRLGPSIGMKDVEKIEGEIGASLPTSYRRFLLEYNGGEPTQPNTVKIPNFPWISTDLRKFLGVGLSEPTSNILWFIELLQENCCYEKFLPIATDSMGLIFCLSLRLDDFDQVIYCDMEEGEFKAYPMGGDFDSFLENIKEFKE